ncbi:hypothetical protein POF53_05555 [Mitsuaria sp. RG]|nr:hypothetical protein [Mitsuaria sp. RG]
MGNELQIPRVRKLATTGVGRFGEAAEEGGQDPLFRVMAGDDGLESTGLHRHWPVLDERRLWS